MEKNIQIFTSDVFGEVRTMTNEKGETFFVGKDVATALGYSNPRKALHDHVDEEDKGVTKRDTLGGTQKMTIINESGLYSLILSSKLPQAKAFKRWVTAEVLPQIRRTGRYELTSKELRLLGEKADYCDEVLQSVDCMTTTQVAKELGMTGPELYRWLVALSIVYWQSGEYMLYADFAHEGFTKTRTHGHCNRLGMLHTQRYLVWTEAGRKFLHEVFQKKEAAR
jgi:prophage antirepressor-like protein